MSGLELRAEEAVALVSSSSRAAPGRVIVGLRHGGHLEADHVVLAVGAPSGGAPWTRLPFPLTGRGLVEQPWSRAALDEIGREDRVLLIGSGLTAIDMVLTLKARGHRGRLFLRSRHGLLPERQLDEPTPPRFLGCDPSADSARELVAAVRVAVEKAEFEGDDWRSVVAGVRFELPGLWRRLDERERSRLLRHAARYWEVHRHRMAPVVAAEVDRLRCNGQLDVAAGHLVSGVATNGAYRVQLAQARREESLMVDAVVNCTGPSRAFRKSRLVDDLLGSGLAVEDPLGIGLLLDAHGDLVGADGSPDPRLHTLGWLRRAQDYESTAIPEIRAQAEALVERIGAAQ